MEKEEPRQRRRNDMGVSHKRGGGGVRGTTLAATCSWRFLSLD